MLTLVIRKHTDGAWGSWLYREDGEARILSANPSLSLIRSGVEDVLIALEFLGYTVELREEV